MKKLLAMVAIICLGFTGYVYAGKTISSMKADSDGGVVAHVKGNPSIKLPSSTVEVVFYAKSDIQFDNFGTTVGTCTETSTILTFCCETALNNSAGWVMPYRVGNDWFIRYSLVCDSTSAPSVYSSSISGIEFPTQGTNAGQAAAMACADLTIGDTLRTGGVGVATSNTNVLEGACTSGSDNWFWSGDALLTGKPKWLLPDGTINQ